MKFNSILALFFISGCSFERNPNSFIEAGMLDEAENSYQKQILAIDDKNIKDKRIKQQVLFNFYIKTDQLEKADKYSSVTLVRKDTGELDFIGMGAMHQEIASALYDAKNYRRAWAHYDSSASFYYADFASKMICEPRVFRSYFLAYDSANKAGLTNRAAEASRIGLEIAKSFPCANNAEAIDFIASFQE